MHRRTFLCAECGKIRRRINAWKVGKGQPNWPRCCDQEMRILHHPHAAATAALTPAERLTWLSFGAGLIQRRKHGNRKWIPAVSAGKAARSEKQLRAYYSTSPRPAGNEKAWALASHRKRHAKKKGE